MKKLYKLRIIFICVVIFISYVSKSNAQLTVTQGGGLGMTPLQLVQQVLVGGGVTVSNASFNGSSGLINSNMVGSFQTAGVATTQLGFTGGVVIASGNAIGAIGPNSSGSFGAMMGTGSDPDLQLLIPAHTVFDKAVLEFDFVPIADTIKFKYVFGSDEFDEFCNTNYNDVFGFFISGPGISGSFTGGAINIALMPNNPTNYVTIDNVCGAGAAYSWLNTSGVYYQYDRLTHVYTAMCVVQPCQNYHIKLAVGDAGDQAYDSGVFLEENSFSTNGINFSTHYTSNIDTVAVEGCNNEVINFTLSHPATAPIVIHYTISGTATEGVDYPVLPDSLIIYPGQDSVGFTIIPISDSIPEPTETVFIVYQNTVCGSMDTITILIKDYTPITAALPPDFYVCSGAAATLSVNAAGGFAPLSYIWTGLSDTTSTVVVNPPVPTEYYVTTADACGQSRIDSVRVSISNLSSAISNVDSVTCFGYIDGTATVAAATGLVPYHYIWSGTNDTTAMTDSLAAGTYTVTVSDNIGCTSTSTVVLVNPPQLAITLTPSDEYCLNSCNGSIANTLIGPYQLPVSFLWSTTPAQTTQNASNLCAGNYTVTVTYSSHSCSVTQSATVSTTPIQATLSAASTDQLCLGACNGTATATIAGIYDLPVAYLWNTVPAQTTATATNLCAGTYTVTVSYSQYNCPLIQTTTVNTTPPQATLSITPSDQFCTGACNGQAAAAFAGTFDPPLIYSWSSVPVQTTATATSLCPGTYTVTATYSQYHCPLVQTTTIGTLPIGDSLILNPVGELCCNGKVNSIFTANAPPVAYHWNNGQTTDSIINLCTGDYTLTVTYSQYHCTMIQTTHVDKLGIISADFSTTPNPAEGLVPLSVDFTTPGIGVVSYHWDFGDGTDTNSQSATHVYPDMGIYAVTLTVWGQDSCSATYTVSVVAIQPSKMSIPNVFTPNGDGVNDVFKIESEGILTIKIDIYDRWGKKIFDFNGAAFSNKDEKKEIWDGTTRAGAKCADGTYYYVIYAYGYDKKEYQLQGTITLLR